MSIIISNPSGSYYYSGSVDVATQLTGSSTGSISGSFDSGSTIKINISQSVMSAIFASGSTLVGNLSSGSSFSATCGSGSTISGSVTSGSSFTAGVPSGSFLSGSFESGSFFSGSFTDINNSVFYWTGSLTSSLGLNGSFSSGSVISGTFCSGSSIIAQFTTSSQLQTQLFSNLAVTMSFVGPLIYSGSTTNVILTGSFYSQSLINCVVSGTSSFTGSFTSSNLVYSSSGWREVHAHNCNNLRGLDVSNEPNLQVLDIISCSAFNFLYMDYNKSLNNITMSGNYNLYTMSFSWAGISGSVLSSLLIQVYTQSLSQSKAGLIIVTGSYSSSLTPAGKGAWNALSASGWIVPTIDRPRVIPSTLYKPYRLQSFSSAYYAVSGASKTYYSTTWAPYSTTSPAPPE